MGSKKAVSGIIEEMSGLIKPYAIEFANVYLPVGDNISKEISRYCGKAKDIKDIKESISDLLISVKSVTDTSVKQEDKPPIKAIPVLHLTESVCQQKNKLNFTVDELRETITEKK